MPITLEKAFDVMLQKLKEVDTGTCRVLNPHQPRFCHNPHYKLEGGWVVVPYNDCGDWDYIERIYIPDLMWWGEISPSFHSELFHFRPESMKPYGWLSTDVDMPPRHS